MGFTFVYHFINKFYQINRPKLPVMLPLWPFIKYFLYNPFKFRVHGNVFVLRMKFAIHRIDVAVLLVTD